MEFDSMPEPMDYVNASVSNDGGARGLVPRFHMLPVKDKAASDAAGRPIFREVEYIEIRVPGDRTLATDEPVTDEHRLRFPQAYQRFKLKGQGAVDGTPLEQWPAITRAEVEELAPFNLRTVEQLAALSDSNAMNIGPWVGTFRTRAQDWLAKAKNDAPMAKVRADLEKRDAELETLRAIVKEQGEKIAAMVAGRPYQASQAPAVAVLAAPVAQEAKQAPKRRGRPPKAKPVEA